MNLPDTIREELAVLLSHAQLSPAQDAAYMDYLVERAILRIVSARKNW